MKEKEEEEVVEELLGMRMEDIEMDMDIEIDMVMVVGREGKK